MNRKIQKNNNLSKIRNTTIYLENKELINLLLGRDGGRTTLLILDEILAHPCNANQISTALHLDYNTITHHLKIAEELDYIEKIELGHIKFIHPSDKLIKYLHEYNIIRNIIKNQENKRLKK